MEAARHWICDELAACAGQDSAHQNISVPLMAILHTAAAEPAKEAAAVLAHQLILVLGSGGGDRPVQVLVDGGRPRLLRLLRAGTRRRRLLDQHHASEVLTRIQRRLNMIILAGVYVLFIWEICSVMWSGVDGMTKAPDFQA